MSLSQMFPRRRGACADRSFSESFEAFEPRVQLDSSLPLVILSIADNDVAEKDSNPGRFTITRFGDTTGPLLVKFQIAGSATPGVDYIGLTGEATIPAGRRSVGLPIFPIDDLTVEGNETVRVILTRDDANYRRDETNPLSRNLAVTIKDNDFLPVVTLATPDQGAAESGDTATFAIRRTGSIELPLTVNFRIGGSATPGADYTAFAPVATIPAGKRAAFIVVRPKSDAKFEGRETVRITLLSSDDHLYALKPEQPVYVSRVIFINDRPLVGLMVTDPVATSAPADEAEFTLFRTGPVDAPLRVSYTLGGNAQSGIDFVRLPEVFTIPAGQSFLRIAIRGTGATLSSVRKTLRITLAPMGAYNLNLLDSNSFSGYVSIIDDTVPPGV